MPAACWSIGKECFSDGDFDALERTVPVTKSNGAEILVDHAHSFLLCGPQGRGVAAMMGALDQIDYLVVTFSKALGGVGGALIAKRQVARYVNWYARYRMFSSGAALILRCAAEFGFSCQPPR